ncbi:RING/U-box superfamily protein [Striga asiatica]|uniref:RING/U-box superfamily protein n=1 Tax=Striga asiatica TaxID=4170 RepID=A0A5A7QXJ6_STRAF|nr:RING/U-box superfamily protein [Striga asiatica]
MVVKRADCSGPKSFESPKSEIFTPLLSCKRMFSGFMSQWIILCSQPEWRYESPLAVPTAISTLSFQSSVSTSSSRKRVLSNEPRFMYSYTKNLCPLLAQKPFSLTRLTWWILPMTAISVKNSRFPCAPKQVIFLTATSVPSLRVPLYTVPNPPEPIWVENCLVDSTSSW